MNEKYYPDENGFVSFQFSLSTGEDEKNYFGRSDQDPPVRSEDIGKLVPGTYRVLDGELFRIVSGFPMPE